MKNLFFKFLVLFLFMGIGYNSFSQIKKTGSTKKSVTKYPASFTVGKIELDKLFSLKVKETFSYPSNKYIDKAQILMNTKNGDILFLKAKLAFFSRASILVQVNGEYTTQVFIMSEDKSVFYKAKQDKDKFILTKCSEDEIVSE